MVQDSEFVQPRLHHRPILVFKKIQLYRIINWIIIFSGSPCVEEETYCWLDDIPVVQNFNEDRVCNSLGK